LNAAMQRGSFDRLRSRRYTSARMLSCKVPWAVRYGSGAGSGRRSRPTEKGLG
jgi:hypothetical protein